MKALFLLKNLTRRHCLFFYILMYTSFTILNSKTHKMFCAFFEKIRIMYLVLHVTDKPLFSNGTKIQERAKLHL